MGKLQYLLGNEQIAILNTDYSDVVQMTVLVPEEKRGLIEERVTDATGGQAALSWGQKLEFAKAGKEILLFTAEAEK